MGYLDEAIREHLELKRRRGAPDTELEQAETEALGPIGPDSPLEELDGPSAEVADEPPPLDEPPVIEVSDEPVADPAAPVAFVPVEPEVAGEADDSSDPEPKLAEPLAEDDPVDQPTSAYSLDELDDAIAPEGARAHARGEHRRQSTPPLREDIERAWRGESGSHDAPPASKDPEAAESDDVLEDTPDFLQETPEHERLWFEQKPPKDFDF
jgi:hypothetical protein